MTEMCSEHKLTPAVESVVLWSDYHGRWIRRRRCSFCARQARKRATA